MNLGSSLRRRRVAGKDKRNQGGERVTELLEGRWRTLLAAVAAVVIGSGGGYLYATQLVYPGPEVVEADVFEVPDLRGLDLTEAETFLRDTGFDVGTVDSIRHPDVPPGEGLGQTPFPGQLALASGRVDLTVSLGPEERAVPDVMRLRADRALTVLETTGFAVLVDSVEADIPEGRVVRTDPQPGSTLTLPSEVRLTVSLGPPMVEMPDLVGMQEEDARAALDSLGLTVGEVETRFRFGFNQGEVLEHHPGPEAMVPAGGEVRLTIGRRGFF